MGEEIMISLQAEETIGLPQATSSHAEARPIAPGPDNASSCLELQTVESRYRQHVSSLQQCICELILSNQQLRTALLDSNAKISGWLD